MNWYKTSNNKNSIFLGLGLAGSILYLSNALNISQDKAKKLIENRSPEAIQLLQEVDNSDSNKNNYNTDKIDRTELKPEVKNQKPDNQNISAYKKDIDINKIIKIESSGNKNAISPTGARGLCQIMKPTWEECVKLMGKNWSWNEAFDPEKNIAVGNFYFNNRIPSLLRTYNIPDVLQTRIAAYNWGIGNLNKAYKKYGSNWISFIPKETEDYIEKYINL